MENVNSSRKTGLIGRPNSTNCTTDNLWNPATAVYNCAKFRPNLSYCVSYVGERPRWHAYTKPQKWKKEESEWLREERDQMKFIDLRFER